ncbi:MAG: S-adenosylmethionine:tRNA ribosyltransferase-isomerase [Bacteroidota bacterium]
METSSRLQRLQQIDLEEYNYSLPDERIAKFPLEQRDASKLLVYKNGKISHRTFSEIPNLLPANSFLFFNNTKVIPARLHFRKDTGALVEVFLLHPVLPSCITATTMAAKGSVTFECLVGNLKRWKDGELLKRNLTINNESFNLTARLVNRDEKLVEISWEPATHTLSELLEVVGQIPIPPYLNREATEKDTETYQTVYAQNDGSVAAPTAGLHFTPAVFEELEKQGIQHDFVTLHVGAGTFQPVKVKDLSTHPMHREQVVYSRQNIENILKHHAHIIPVGTTSMRTLESIYWYGVKLLTDNNKEFLVDKLAPYISPLHISVEESMQVVLDFMQQNNLQQLIGETELLIAPGYEFKVCKGLVTNFHQPASTLLLLVDALVNGNWKTIYNQALENNYRFLSYGDSSLLLP